MVQLHLLGSGSAGASRCVESQLLGSTHILLNSPDHRRPVATPPTLPPLTLLYALDRLTGILPAPRLGH
jgi:hypothetical protein